MKPEERVKAFRVLEEVFQERIKQHAKFGEQNCPSLDQSVLKGYRATTEKMAKAYSIPEEEEAQKMVKDGVKFNCLTYADILIEEVCEVVGCMHDEEKMREELIQVAAVAVQWIEAIDRRKKG